MLAALGPLARAAAGAGGHLLSAPLAAVQLAETAGPVVHPAYRRPGQRPTLAAVEAAGLLVAPAVLGVAAPGLRQPAVSGTANTAGGGGGGATSAGTTAGSGGSGIVVLRYPSSLRATIGAGLVSTTTVSGAETVIEITGGTADTIIWN